jgi:hippurate hydrolase
VNIIEEIADRHGELTAWRRDIHAHPELGFEEHRTSDFVAAKLREFGLDVHTGIGKTGVVGTLRVGNTTRSVGLRADMDALPISESNTFAHRSVHEGKMHACGHDGHTAILLGAAQYLSATRNFDGQVNFIFQPAEEGIGGARAMIEDGLFDQFPCDCIFGMHNRPSLPVGKFAVRAGAMMAGGAFFDIDITGKGAHGARPETGIDPIIAASQIVLALQTIVSRNARAVDTAVLSVTQVHSGDAYNVIPHTARMSGTVRAFSKDVMALVERRLREISSAIATGMGATVAVDFRNTFLPTINDLQEAEYAARICSDLVGTGNVVRDPPLIMASEDFSYMLDKVPGCYINIGNGGRESDCEVHHPAYDFNDDAIPLGSSFFARLVEKRLANGK